MITKRQGVTNRSDNRSEPTPTHHGCAPMVAEDGLR